MCNKEIFICLELHGVVYVDESKGTLNTTCGFNQSVACRYLSSALNQSRGVVHIIGNVTLNETIPLNKDVHFTTNEQDQGKIIGVGKVTYTFIANMSNISIYITRISFIGIDILYTTLTTYVRLHNVLAIGGKFSLIYAEQNIGKPVHMSFTISNSTFLRANVVVEVLGKEHKSFTVNVNISCSTFTDTRGIDAEYSNGDINIHKCVFQHHQGSSPVFVSHARTASISSSTFSNNYGNPCLELESIQHVFITKSTFHNGTTVRQLDPGCIFLLKITECFIEHSKFTKCHSEKASGGAMFITNPRNLTIIRNCTFIGNKAVKSGGAIYVMYMNNFGKRQMGTTLIKDCIFQHNEAVQVGQAIHSTGKCFINLQNITILTNGNKKVTHLQLGGDKVTLGTIQVVQGAPGITMGGSLFPGIMVVSDDLNINGSVTYVCPKNFDVAAYHTSHVNWNRANIFTSFETRCVACRPSMYTLKKGMLTVHPLESNKWSEQSSHAVCYPCPSGAKCDGNILPLQNHWGYQVSDKEIVFTQCPNGYCCSSQRTPCTEYNTCNKGRTGLLCGSCGIGYA